MSHISIIVAAISNSDNDPDDLFIQGEARVNNQTQAVSFSLEVPFNSLTVDVNAAIRDAAIAAAESQLSVTIGALDKKTLYAGAVGL